MSARKPLDAEMVRILKAARDGSLYLSLQGRWKITEAANPDRRARELLVARGYIAPSWRIQRGDSPLTTSGRFALEAALGKDPS